jgi:DNA-binding transcriptional ArsR family regulator
MLDVSATSSPELDAVFFALCDQTRRGLLGRLRGVELTAGALADGFHVTRPAVSRHLRILREARLVSERRRGRERVYTLTPEPLAGATGWLEDYRAFWSARLSDLKSLIESLPDDEQDAVPVSASPATSPAPPLHRPAPRADDRSADQPQLAHRPGASPSSGLRTSAAAPPPEAAPSSASPPSATAPSATAPSASPPSASSPRSSPAEPPAVDLPFASPSPLDPSRSRR